jgi:hypothetical protein
MLIGDAVNFHLKDLLLVISSGACIRIDGGLVSGNNGDAFSEFSEKGQGGETAHGIGETGLDAAGGIAGNAEESAAWFADGAEIDFDAGKLELGVFPYMVLVAFEEAVYTWVSAFDVDFAAADRVGVDSPHAVEEVKDVKSVILQAKSVQILEVNAKDIVRFVVAEFGSPGLVVLEVVGVK